jgi:predicted secreted Zn-dependent protease
MTTSDLTHVTWTKSSYSGAQGECLEIAVTQGMVHARDSKNPHGPALHFTRDDWADFINGVTRHEFRI